MNTLDEVIDIVTDCIKEHTIVDLTAVPINFHKSLNDIMVVYNLDSLDLVEIIMELNTKLNITIKDHEIDRDRQLIGFIYDLMSLQEGGSNIRKPNPPITRKSIDWDQVLINASISALQGIQESGKIGEILEVDCSAISKYAVRIGKSLVKELKKEIH